MAREKRSSDDGQADGRIAGFPLTIYIVHHLPTNSFGCVRVDGVTGLACFRSAERAVNFAMRMETRQNLISEVTMADAREIAGGVTPNLTALILSDNEINPVVHEIL